VEKCYDFYYLIILKNTLYQVKAQLMWSILNGFLHQNLMIVCFMMIGFHQCKSRMDGEFLLFSLLLEDTDVAILWSSLVILHLCHVIMYCVVTKIKTV